MSVRKETIGEHVLYCGDNREVLAEIRGVHACVTDPPYGLGKEPKGEAVFDDAKRWDGWGTALKPAHEPIIMARKPFRGTVAANALAHGTGAINIDACRIGWAGDDDKAAAAAAAAQRVCRDTPGRERWNGTGGIYLDPQGSLATWEAKAELGRWPANVLHDGSLEVLEQFSARDRPAARFFYSPKANRAEREAGLRDLPKTRIYGAYGDGIGLTPKVKGERPQSASNIHPTVKPVALMAWLCRLVTPPGGVVLDPFMGSGSTGIAAARHGFRFIGIEQDPVYFDIACRRVAHAVEQDEAMPTIERAITTYVRAQQLSMFDEVARGDGS